MLRYVNEPERKYYYFAISGDRRYTLVYDNLDVEEPTTDLVSWRFSDAINPGKQTNRLKVVAIGNTIELYVNDQLLDTVQDDLLSQGSVGFLVSSSFEGGVQVSFDNLIVTAP